MLILATLIIALLFGGMVLYSFGFAAFLFSALPHDVARPTIRRAFPLFYLFVLGTAALASALIWSSDAISSGLLAIIALSVIPTRQLLMPAINRATDAGNKTRFVLLHGASVIITLSHIGLAGNVLARLAG